MQLSEAENEHEALNQQVEAARKEEKYVNKNYTRLTWYARTTERKYTKQIKLESQLENYIVYRLFIQ